MKKLSFLLVFIAFLNCSSDNQINNCFQNLTFNETINLDNPEFINILTPGSNFTFSRFGRDLMLFHRGTNPRYRVFDLECPQRNCTLPMSFDGFKFKCPCHNKEYNSLNGSPIDNEGCPALEYNVLEIGGNSLQITR